MITKVTYRPYASGVNNTQTQPQKVSFGAHSPQEVGRVLTARLGNLTNSGTRGSIKPDILGMIDFLREHCGVSEEICKAAKVFADALEIHTVTGLGFFRRTRRTAGERL